MVDLAALRRALVAAAPRIGLFLAISILGYLYVRTWLWLVVFAFGSLAALVDRFYYRKTLELQERLRER